MPTAVKPLIGGLIVFAWSLLTAGYATAAFEIAESKVRTRDGFCEGRFDPFVWKVVPEPGEDRRVHLKRIHGEDKAYLACHSEKTPMEQLRSATVQSIKSSDEEAVIKEEKRKVNGVNVLFIRAEVVTSSISPITYWIYLYSGERGTVRYIVTHVGPNERFKKVFSGFVDSVADSNTVVATAMAEDKDAKKVEPAILKLLNGLKIRP